ncbi:MAG: rhodanese-like domain-containing protein [Parcubacteria group bacterium]|jgi:hydroxyacylglutathione hydrolase
MGQNKDNQKAFIAGFILILLVILWVILKPAISSWKGSKSQNAEDKMAEVFSAAPTISASDLYKELEQNYDRFIIDTRSAIEFKKGHIAASKNLDRDSLSVSTLTALGVKKTTEIILIDNPENIYKTAGKVTELLGSGLVEVKYLEGGLASWTELGYALVSSGGSDLDSSKVKKISLEQLKSDLERSSDLVQIIDIRESSAYNQGHLKGAENFPLADLEKGKKDISSIKEVVVYGGSEESFNAVVALFDLNFFNVYQLNGNYEDWKNSGGNIEN